MSQPSEHLPLYVAEETKAALLKAGASGTVYSLVMPESEAALSYIIDGADQRQAIEAQAWPSDELAGVLSDQRSQHYFSMYHEPWTQKQDVMHEAYFDTWFEWVAPVVDLDRDTFPNRYPTAGASEGIFKMLAEFAARMRHAQAEAIIHMFEGEYEGFPAYAAALGITVVRHDRRDWEQVAANVSKNSQFWISQPSAIDGQVWEPFGEFVLQLQRHRPNVELIPDLTYVGNVAKSFRINLNSPNIPAIVFSHSKPFGGYYHRVGGVVCRNEFASLFGNKWFKNLQSLAWATEMMRRHDVHELAGKYRPVQEQAVKIVGRALGVSGLKAADVSLLAIAEPTPDTPEILRSVLRGSGDEAVIRLCLTPVMTCLIDPAMAPVTFPELREAMDMSS